MEVVVRKFGIEIKKSLSPVVVRNQPLYWLQHNKNGMDNVSSMDFLHWSPVEPVTETLLAHGMDEFLLPSEYVVKQVDSVVLVNIDVSGTLLITNFRLVFLSNAPSQLIPLGTIPLAMIDKFTEQLAPPTHRTASLLIEVVGKDMRILVYAFPVQVKLWKLIFDELTRRMRAWRLSDMYSFICKPSMLRNSNPSMRLLEEYLRLLDKSSNKWLSNKWWRICDLNANYNVCPTYPSRFIVPLSISDEEVLQAARFRARGRLPVITWCHSENGAVLARSSQPFVGIMNIRRSISDEKLVAALCISQSPPGMSTKPIYIADARPRKNAFANIAKGGGSESSSNYSQAKVVFLGIDNIHAVRVSFSLLRDYLDKHGTASSDGLSSFSRQDGWNWGGGHVSVSGLGDSRWVMHIHRILDASAWIAARIALEGASVLVHCSDGWDRTTQLVSLASLLLDPYYRTFEGFQVLIEKDWLAFGHPFADRLGMPTFNTNTPRAKSSAANTPENYSPVFLQWIDCVAQILGMYPRAFEFSSAYLVEIVDCVVSGRFADFLCNTENDRQQVGIADSCGCMWVYLTQLRRSSERSEIHEHCNSFYSPDEHPGPLLPPPAALAPTLWSRFHLRWASPLEARCGSEIKAHCFKELQKEKEKMKDMATNAESLTEQLVSEKSVRRSAVAVATRAWQENVAIKRALESAGFKVNFSRCHESIYTDISRAEDIEKKIMRMSQKELSEIEDVDEVKQQEDQKNDMSVSISFSAESDLHESLFRKRKSTRSPFSGV